MHKEHAQHRNNSIHTKKLTPENRIRISNYFSINCYLYTNKAKLWISKADVHFSQQTLHDFENIRTCPFRILCSQLLHYQYKFKINCSSKHSFFEFEAIIINRTWRKMNNFLPLQRSWALVFARVELYQCQFCKFTQVQSVDVKRFSYVRNTQRRRRRREKYRNRRV